MLAVLPWRGAERGGDHQDFLAHTCHLFLTLESTSRACSSLPSFQGAGCFLDPLPGLQRRRPWEVSSGSGHDPRASERVLLGEVQDRAWRLAPGTQPEGWQPVDLAVLPPAL